MAQRLKCLPPMRETGFDPWVWSLGQEDPLEKEMATYSSILAWRFPWTEEPGRLQSTGSQSRTQLSDFTFTSSNTWMKPQHFFFFSDFVCVHKSLRQSQLRLGGWWPSVSLQPPELPQMKSETGPHARRQGDTEKKRQPSRSVGGRSSKQRASLARLIWVDAPRPPYTPES